MKAFAGGSGIRHPYRSFKQPRREEARPLSAVVAARLELAKAVYNLVTELHPTGTYTPDLRNTLFHALADQVIEHLGAVIHLVERRQFFGSAFALLRPLIETYLRAVWIHSIASDADFTAIREKKKDVFPSFSRCRAAVEAYFELNGVPGLYAMDKEFVTSLHGFTHSGLEQIVNRFDSSLHITPYEYPDSSVMALLDQAGRFAVMAAMVLVQAIDGSAEVMAPKVDLLQRRFNQLRSSYVA